MQTEVMTQISDAASSQLQSQACSHQISSIQELPKTSLGHPSSDTSKNMINSKALFNKRSKLNAAPPPPLTLSDTSLSSHGSIIHNQSSPPPSSCDDSCSEDTYSSSSTVPSPLTSISPKHLAQTAGSKSPNEEELSPKRTRTGVDRVTTQDSSTADILTHPRAIYSILRNTPSVWGRFIAQERRKQDLSCTWI